MLNTFVEGNFFALSKGALFAKKVVGVTRVILEVRGFVMALRPCHHVGNFSIIRYFNLEIILKLDHFFKFCAKVLWALVLAIPFRGLTGTFLLTQINNNTVEMVYLKMDLQSVLIPLHV